MCLPDCFEWLISHSPAPAMVMVNWKSMSMANTPHPPAPAKAPAPAPAPESPQSQRHIIFASACVRHVSPGCAPLLYSFLINLQHAKPMTVPLSACRCRKERNVSGRQTSWAVNFNLYSNDILFLPFSILSRARVTQGPCPKRSRYWQKFKNNFLNLPQRFVLCLTHFHKARTNAGIIMRE